MRLARAATTGYVEALEHRLQVTENALLKLLSQVSDAQLSVAMPQNGDSIREPDNTYQPFSRLGKQGVDDWARFPLDTPRNARQWQQSCMGSQQFASGDQLRSMCQSPLSSGSEQRRPKRKRVQLEKQSDPAVGESRAEKIPSSLSQNASSPVSSHPPNRQDPHSPPHISNQGADENIRLATVQTLSSWDAAPSLSFQRQFLW
ncbi:hypothetical protein NUU61_009273 [Penicillium alfredii]|uniref:Uncharacterized protein n=1 Tax=Penicillium alfredii TaxID=1506179 RepID=A0A9W9EMZ8_9EURO|nr:uncharacterized protein NUU61_009273 [Penicillium alfredii]KAJ5084694.1 hypothetical protein NUU61_009273 [Penicillium alfredii]